MAKSKSKLSLSERRELAFQLFARGYTNRDVASRLRVSEDTAGSYRKHYEERIHAQAAANPAFLRDVLSNTVRSLTELDAIRADAWQHLEPRSVKFECTECGHREKVKIEVSDQTRAQYHNVLLKAQDQRSKLFGVLGVKQEVLVAVAQIIQVRDKMIEWMGRNLCAEDREALASFLEGELGAYMGEDAPSQAFRAIDTVAVESHVTTA